MILKNYRFIIPALVFAGTFSSYKAECQSSGLDSLSLSSTVKEVVQNHPAVKKAMEDLNGSDARIGAANSAKYPFVDFESSYSRIGPVSTLTVPDLGSFSFMPHDNYSAAFNLNQSIYDFG